MPHTTPRGFFVTGLFSAIFCWTMLIFLQEPLDGGDVHDVLAHGIAGLLAALSAVTTEALWRARPWAWRASATLAAAYVLAVLIVVGGSESMDFAIGVLLASSVMLAPTLAYIHNRSARLWPGAARGPAPVHLPAASPYPPAHVAAARAAGRP